MSLRAHSNSDAAPIEVALPRSIEDAEVVVGGAAVEVRGEGLAEEVLGLGRVAVHERRTPASLRRPSEGGVAIGVGDWCVGVGWTRCVLAQPPTHASVMDMVAMNARAGARPA
jgi:hypothetical protein